MTVFERLEKLAEAGRFTVLSLQQTEDGWQADAEDRNGRAHSILAASPTAAFENLLARIEWATGGPIKE
jgi:hypothetical protein